MSPERRSRVKRSTRTAEQRATSFRASVLKRILISRVPTLHACARTQVHHPNEVACYWLSSWPDISTYVHGHPRYRSGSKRARARCPPSHPLVRSLSLFLSPTPHRSREVEKEERCKNVLARAISTVREGRRVFKTHTHTQRRDVMRCHAMRRDAMRCDAIRYTMRMRRRECHVMRRDTAARAALLRLRFFIALTSRRGQPDWLTGALALRIHTHKYTHTHVVCYL